MRSPTSSRSSARLAALGLALLSGGRAGEDAQAVDRLVSALGSSAFEEREKASRKLLEMGDAAEPAIRRAAKESDDEETRSRADRLLDRFPFRARIVDEAGKPIPNAEYLADFNSPGVIFSGMRRWQAVDGGGRFSLKIDETIEVEDGKKLPVFYDLQVRAPGFAPAFVFGITWRSHEAEIVLRRGVLQRGKVLDEEGKPLAGTEVSLRHPNRLGLWYAESTKTDAEGRFAFRLSPLPPLPDAPAQWIVSWKGIECLVRLPVGGGEPEEMVFRDVGHIPDLSKAARILIRYSVEKRQDRSLTVDRAEDIRALGAAFKVRNADGMRVMLLPPGTIEAHFEGDAPPVKLFFVDPDEMSLQGVGAIQVDPAFYGKVNALLSQKEGRPIDILKETNRER